MSNDIENATRLLRYSGNLNNFRKCVNTFTKEVSTLYVLMCNDYPEGVYDSHIRVKKQILDLKYKWKLEHKHLDSSYYPCPHYRYYEFKLNEYTP